MINRLEPDGRSYNEIFRVSKEFSLDSFRLDQYYARTASGDVVYPERDYPRNRGATEAP